LLICFLATLPTTLFPARGSGAPGPKRAPVALKPDLIWRTELGGKTAWGSWWLGGSPSFSPLAFSGSGFLIVASRTPVGRAPNTPRAVHCILLDAQTGRVLGERDWTVVESRVTVLPTRDGGIIVRKNRELVLYSPRLRALANYPLDSRDNDIRGLGYVVQGVPGLDLVAVERWFDDNRRVEITWLRADTLRVKLTRLFQQKFGYEVGGMFSLEASRHTALQILRNPLPTNPAERKVLSAVGVRVNPAPYPPSGLYVRDPEGKPRMIFAGPKPVEMSAMFASDHTILACTPHGFFLLSDSGRVLFSEKLRKHEYTYAWAVVAGLAASGNRLAVPVLKTEGLENEMLHLSTHVVLKRVMIYDLPSMRLADALDGKHPNLRHVSAIALSPHGHRLAILREGAVELYRLPR
jgi:hypothetical protein